MDLEQTCLCTENTSSSISTWFNSELQCVEYKHFKVDLIIRDRDP